MLLKLDCCMTVCQIYHFNDIFSGTYGNSTSTPLSQSYNVKKQTKNKQTKFWISNYNRLS